MLRFEPSQDDRKNIFASTSNAGEVLCLTGRGMRNTWGVAVVMSLNRLQVQFMRWSSGKRLFFCWC